MIQEILPTWLYKIWIVYWIAINLVTFVVYGIDKWKAQNEKWRISEFTLLLLAVIGGSIGALFGMIIWRHKTQHLKFRIGIPVIIILQLALMIWLYCQCV